MLPGILVSSYGVSMVEKKAPKPADVAIGKNLVILRGDMSQADLANKMRTEKGHPWSQATVWNIEKGDRPLRLSEAKDLSDLLGFNLSLLFQPPLEHQYTAEAEEALRNVASKSRAAAYALADLMEARSDYWFMGSGSLEERQARWVAHVANIEKLNELDIWNTVKEAFYLMKDEPYTYPEEAHYEIPTDKQVSAWSGVERAWEPDNVPPVNSPEDMEKISENVRKLIESHADELQKTYEEALNRTPEEWAQVLKELHEDES